MALNKAQFCNNRPGNTSKTFFSDDCPSCVSVVGRSEATAKMLRMTGLVARSSCNPVLIVGETGTGKELAARAVHILRNGSGRKLVAIDCAAMPPDLLERELFGYVRGAFAGASHEKTGILELVETGSIFLNEISEMPIDLQAGILRVVQEKTFRKLGGVEDIKFKATIIASSSRNLPGKVKKGKFRRDLYYRLSICPINLAPLRDESRQDDIILLAEYFVANSDICPEKKGMIKGLTRLAARDIKKHHWPGNVRELKNVIERAILLETGDKIGRSNLTIDPDEFEIASCKPVLSGLKEFSLERAERELVAKAMAEADWKKRAPPHSLESRGQLSMQK